MVTKEQVMPLLLDAYQSFTEKWEEHCAYWEGGNLLYNDLAKFNQHLFHLYTSNQISEFSAIFEVIENLHLKNDNYVKKAATIGLLKGIQNLAGNSISEKLVINFNLFVKRYILKIKPNSPLEHFAAKMILRSVRFNFFIQGV
jgi:hypothetical protein